MKALFLSLVLSSLALLSPARNQLDSLWEVGNDPKNHDTIRCNALNQLAVNGFLYSRPDSAEQLAQMAYNLAKTNKAFPQMAAAKNTLGISYALRGLNQSALSSFKESLSIWEKLGNKNGIATAHGSLGLIQKRLGNFIQAMDHYQLSLRIMEELGDKGGVATILMNIGIIYKNQKDYTKALHHFNRCLQIDEEQNNQRGMARSLGNIANVYVELSEMDKALTHYERSYDLSKETNDVAGMAGTLLNIGNIYLRLEDHSKALTYFQNSLALQEQLGDLQAIARSLISMGTTAYNMQNTTEAINYCEKGLEKAKEIQDPSLEIDACFCLTQAHKSAKNWQKALEYLELRNQLYDGLQSDETEKRLQKFEFERKMLRDSVANEREKRQIEVAHQKELRRKNNSRNILMGAGLLFLIIAAGLYNRLRYTTRTKKIIEQEKDRSENLLLNILPAEIAEELKVKGKADARDYEDASILFTDFKGFTQISEQLSPEQLVNEINLCFEAFDGICEKYEIEKIKTIGDAYMAAGGLPVAKENSTKNTVLAALEMQSFMKERLLANQPDKKAAFQMRAGIHTGPVVAGIVGVKKFQYDIWGDTVNTANRMESSGEVGKVNISETTYRKIKNEPEFEFVSRGKIRAKGKGELDMYFVSLKAKV